MKVILAYIANGKVYYSGDVANTLSLLYLKNFACSNSYINQKVDIIIKFFGKENIESICNKLLLNNPNLIGFSCFTDNITQTLKLCKMIKEYDKNLIIILGGPEIVEVDKIMKNNDFIDICVRGEGEEIFTKILLFYLKKMDIKNIEGIAYRENNKIIINPGWGLVKDLSKIPLIFTNEIVNELRGCVPYQISRGCYFNCKFCGDLLPRRFFPIERVEEELRVLLSSPHIHQIDFSSVDIDWNVEYLKKILEIIKKYNNKSIKFWCCLSGLLRDKEIYKLLTSVGFIRFTIGLQTLNRKIIKNIGRKWQKLSSIKRIIKELLKYIPLQNIKIGSVIYGLPGQTYQEFKNTLNWCQKMNLVNIGIYPLHLFPGTELKINAKKYGIKYYDKPDLHYTISHTNTFSKEDIIKAKSLSFYFTMLIYILTRNNINNIKNLNKINIYLTDIAEKLPILNNKLIRKFGVDKDGEIDGFTFVKREVDKKKAFYFILTQLKKLEEKDLKIKKLLEMIYNQ